MGNEVHQAGSQVEENRCRFDFSFLRQINENELKQVETLINKWVGESYPVNTKIMKIEEAKKTGAMALFGEKYEDDVRVVSVGENGIISKELCGGCHVKNTGEMRLVKIVSESAISAGTRRIEIICSNSALNLLNEKSDEIDKLTAKFKTPVNEINARVEKLFDENKHLQKEIEELKAENVQNKFNSFISKAQDFKGGKLFISKVEFCDAEALKVGAEFLSNKLGKSIIILVSRNSVFAKVSDDFVKEGINAGKIVGEIAKATGGNGGGRPQFAQGGLKDLSNIDNILAGIEEGLKK